MKRQIIALGLAMVCAGCGQQSGSGGILGRPDPKTTFERFAPQFLDELQKYYTAAWEADPNPRRDTRPNEILLSEALYDIRKTDSLVHPYEGIITYSYISHFRTGPFKQTWQLHFGFENGKWIPTSCFAPQSGRTGRILGSTSWRTAYERVKQ